MDWLEHLCESKAQVLAELADTFLRLRLKTIAKVTAKVIRVKRLFIILLNLILLNGCISPNLVALDEMFSDEGARDYAFLVCMASSYDQAGYSDISRQLSLQAFKIFENSQQKAKVFAVMYRESKRIGQQIPLNAAGDICSRWRRSRTLNDLMGYRY